MTGASIASLAATADNELNPPPPQPKAARAGAGSALTAGLLVTPAVLYLLVLFIIPIGYVLLLSFTDPRVSLDNYRRLFTVPLYAHVMLNTFKVSFIVTLSCLGLGYPLAYVMARRLAREGGMLVGISAAAAVAGSLKIAGKLSLKKGQQAVIVTILCDSGDKYLSERFWTE